MTETAAATPAPRIRAAIVGYGNLGRSVERLIGRQPDMELVGIFSRRSQLGTNAPVLAVDEADAHADRIDVLFLCLGSATDIPEQAAGWARRFTTVDTYDNHGDIPATAPRWTPPPARAARSRSSRAAGTRACSR